MDKLCYKLEVFEGPIDLLLHLITKNKLNIYDIPISTLLEQYLEHIGMMKEQNIDVKSDFLEMAARLVYIKTATLLPRQEPANNLKQELTSRLLEYEEYKKIAQNLALQNNMDFIPREPTPLELPTAYELGHRVSELTSAYIVAFGRSTARPPLNQENFSDIVSRKVISVGAMAICVLRTIRKGGRSTYASLFAWQTCRSQTVATFLAVLELIKGHRIFIFDDQGDGELTLGISEKHGGERWKSRNRRR